MQYHRRQRHTRRATAPLGKRQPSSSQKDKVPSRNSSKTQSSQPSPGKDTIPNQKQATSTRTLRRRVQVDNRNRKSSSSIPSGSGFTERREFQHDGGRPPQQLNTVTHKPCISAFVDGKSTNSSACEPTVTDSSRKQCRSTTTTSSSLTPDTTPGSSVSFIHRFLHDCSPPLDHLLSRFVDVGFQTPAILREVAEKWTTEERRELMKRVEPGLNGKKITELELAALERGFQALYSRSKSSFSHRFHYQLDNWIHRH